MVLAFALNEFGFFDFFCLRGQSPQIFDRDVTRTLHVYDSFGEMIHEYSVTIVDSSHTAAPLV